MKLNNKGFTLIEILMVITILAIILAIAIPNTTYNIKVGEDKIYVINDEVFLETVNLYVVEFNDELVWVDNGLEKSTCFYFDVLYEKGYFTKDIDLSKYEDNSIKVIQNNGVNSYFLVSDCNN